MKFFSCDCRVLAWLTSWLRVNSGKISGSLAKKYYNWAPLPGLQRGESSLLVCNVSTPVLNEPFTRVIVVESLGARSSFCGRRRGIASSLTAQEAHPRPPIVVESRVVSLPRLTLFSPGQQLHQQRAMMCSRNALLKKK